MTGGKVAVLVLVEADDDDDEGYDGDGDDPDLGAKQSLHRRQNFCKNA